MRQVPRNPSRRSRKEGAVVLAGLLPLLAAIHGPAAPASLETETEAVRPGMESVGPETESARPAMETRQDPAVLEEVSGDGQTGAPGETLEEPLVVRVLDEEDEPYAGHLVTFSTGSGPGTPELSETEVLTDADGEASTVVTLDDGQHAEGTHEILAEAEDDLEGSPVEFAVTVEVEEEEPEPTILQMVSGDDQSAEVSQELDDPFVVEVLDQEGDPYAGHPISFAVTQEPGDGALLSVAEAETGADGAAATHLTLGDEPGVHEVDAEAAGDLEGSPQTFTAMAEEEEPEPTVLEMVSGDGQSTTVGEELDAPLVVRVLDQDGEPYAGHTVSFAITQEPGDGASLSQTTTETGADGEASTHLTLGDEPGVHEVEAEAAGDLEDSPQTFTATAEEEEPVASEMELVSGDGQSAPVGEELDAPLVVRVLDQNGEPYAGHTVSFEITFPPGGGHGASLSTTSTATGFDGEASTELTLGTEPGEYEVTAQATNPLDGSPVIFTATAEALDPARLVFQQQPPDGLPGAPLSPAPAVRVEDEAGDPVSEPVAVTLSLASDGSPDGDASLGGTLTVESQDGVAVFDEVTVDRPGEGFTLEASAPDVPAVESDPFDIRAPSLAVAVEVSDPDPRVGETVHVGVSVANQEEVTVSGVAISVELPGTRVDVVEEEASQGSFSATQEVWEVGTLGPGGQAHLSLGVVVRAVEPGEIQ